MVKVTIEDKQAAVAKANQKLAVEHSQAEFLFTGFHQPGTPASIPLADYYDNLNGNIYETTDARLGAKVMVKHPNIKQIEDYCIQQNGTLFYDVYFPPNDESLYKMADPSKEKPLSKRPLIIWKRPSEFFNKKSDGQFCLYNSIQANDIKQGLLGDCWLMCSLSAAAEFPIIVEEVFVGGVDSYSPYGIYQVRLYKEGIEEVMQLDDYFPCSAMGGPIYSKANGNELWVMLIEKAFAKYCGSYAAICAGKPFEALIDITGCPWYEFRFSDKEVKKSIENEALFDKIMSFDTAGYIMSITTAGEDHKSDSDHSGGPSSGILAGHAYTLYSSTKLSNGVKLFRIRNPWGNFEWTGDWGDDSPLWTPALKAEMESNGYSMAKADDGMFWMAFHDVAAHFVGINVVLAPKKFKWNTSRSTFVLKLGDNDKYGMKAGVFKLTVQEGGHFFFSVHQKDRRVIGSVGYFDFGVTILKRIDTDGDCDPDFEFIESSGISSERQLQTEVEFLDVGEYWVVPTSTGAKIKQFVEQGHPEFRRSTAGLVVHSQKAHTLEFMKDDDDDDVEDEQDIEMRKAREHAMEDPVLHRKDAEVKDPYNDGSLLVSSIRNGYAGRSYAVMNKTDDKSKFPKGIYYRVVIDVSDSKNVISHRGNVRAEVIVAPGESEIVHHCFPAQDGVGGFTVTARRTQKKLTQDEVVAYLNENKGIYDRLKEKNGIDFDYTHPLA